jgi:hypothetical protein
LKTIVILLISLSTYCEIIAPIVFLAYLHGFDYSYYFLCKAFDNTKYVVLVTLQVLGTVGHPVKHTEIKVVDMETGEVLPDGSKGVVKVRGPQVMKGYYKVQFSQFTDTIKLLTIN